MKRIIPFIISLIIIFSALSATACTPNNENYLSAKQIASTLLARERLNDNISDLSKEFISPSSSSAVNDLVLGSLNKGVKASALKGNFNLPTQAYPYYEMDEFADYSDDISYMKEYMGFSERDAELADDLIEHMKNNVGVTDKWTGEDSGHLLEVTKDADIVYYKSTDAIRIVRRYTRADATNVYEFYSNYGTGVSYTYYIPGERYEIYSSGGSVDDLYMIIDCDKGYWNMTYYLYGEGDTPQNSDLYINNAVMMDDMAFVFSPFVSADYGNIRYTAISTDLKKELFAVSPNSFTLQVAAFDGIEKVRFSEDEKITVTPDLIYDDIVQIDFHRIKSDYAFGAIPLEVVLTDGTVMTGRLSNGITSIAPVGIEYDYGTVGIDTNEDYDLVYHADLTFCSDNDSVTENLAEMLDYLEDKGITVKDIDKETLVNQSDYIVNHIKSFYGYTTFEGKRVDSVESFSEGVDIFKERITTLTSMFSAVKNNGVMTFEETERVRFMKNTALPSLPLSGTATVTDEGVTLNNAKATYADGSWFEGTAYGYELALGLVKVEESGYLPETLVALEKITDYDESEPTAPSSDRDLSASVTFNQNAKYAFPEVLSDGNYELVAFIVNSDGVRVTALKSVASANDYNATESVDIYEIKYTAAANSTLKAEVKVTVSLTVTAQTGVAYTVDTLSAYLKEQIALNGYYVNAYSPLKLYNQATGAETEITAQGNLTAGTYRMPFSLKDIKGDFTTAYIYCTIA